MSKQKYTDRLALSTDEAAAALGVSRSYIWRLMKDGLLPFASLGDGARPRRVIRVVDLNAWLDRQVVTSTQDTGEGEV